MIKLYYLEIADPVTGYGIRAGFTYNGKRYTALVVSRGHMIGVSTGTVRDHDRLYHPFTENQISAAWAFMNSGSYSVEYAAPIV